MQEFASRNATPPAPPGEHWPSAEELAAYIDGTLDKAEKERITEHLASCEECYSTYAETLHFQLESDPSLLENNLVQFRSRDEGHGSWWWRAAAIAALLLIAVGSVVYKLLLAPPPALKTAEVVALIPAPKPGQDFWRGETNRGGDDGEETPLEDEIPYSTASFRTGVLLVNLEVSLKARRTEDAQDMISRIIVLLKTQVSTGPLKEDYTTLTGSVETRPLQDLLSDASRLAEEIRDVFDTDFLDLGQWVEGGRLAALAGDSSFFQRSHNRSFLRRFLWRQNLGLGETKIDPEAVQTLEDISAVLGKGQLRGSDYADLQSSFERILEIYYPET